MLSKYVIPCDFDSMAQQSLTVGKMMEEGNDRPTVLERCCGDEIFPRPLAFQLVAFFLSAKAKDGTHIFVSRDGFLEAKKEENKTCMNLSVFDRIFLDTVRKKGLNTLLLWSELMGIAHFLSIPALERLVRTAVILDEGKPFKWDE